VSTDSPQASDAVTSEQAKVAEDAGGKATTFYDDPDVIAKVSRGLGEAMVGINVEDMAVPHRLAERGW
jgi:pyridoxal biosynthesis lyase PdxS